MCFVYTSDSFRICFEYASNLFICMVILYSARVSFAIRLYQTFARAMISGPCFFSQPWCLRYSGNTRNTFE